MPHRAGADGIDGALGGVAAGRDVPVLVAVLVFPQLALWLPHKLGY